MPANECIPWFEPGTNPTVHATPAAIRGKRFVEVSAAAQGSGPLLSATSEGGNIVAQEASANTDRALGVAAHDAAIGEKVMVFRQGVVPVTSGAAVTAGARVVSDSQGRAVTRPAIPGTYDNTYGPETLGVAVTTVAGADLDVYVALSL